MEIQYLNMYQRLRDFAVPIAVLDELFSNEEDLNLLETTWDILKKDGLNGDEIAEEIAITIFRELNISPDQHTDENNSL